ncbi:polysaccharide biosynthesis protein [Nocardioides jishulii]|uniref:Polysaccharide biosynthesis protein n=1 Tax=Nocardioides jishulii TaxID=2575440 RepID=A0A4U2YSF1_9ACTN|nr:polysaccharide biosynthesis protein [Nocardioides jishulii]TKI63705.1 polysaccharide biosynthesis protein [Nocardioides jishulii]
MSRLQRHRTLVVTTFDVIVWVASFLVWTVVRLEGEVTDGYFGAALMLGVTAAALHLILGSPVRLHQGRSKLASLEEAIRLTLVTVSVAALVFVANFSGLWVPRSIPAGAGLLTVIVCLFGRAAWRRVKEMQREREQREGTTRVLLIGAGESAYDLVVSMLRDPAKVWRPVGMLDDDPAKRHYRVRGVQVLGTTDQIAEIAAATEVDTIVIAIPSADAETIARFNLAGVEAGLKVKVLPAPTENLGEHVGIRDLRDIDLHDVLGRNQLDTDIESIADYIAGKRVLVTGAGGSIGSELCRQIHRFKPADLMMLDRDESALHSVQLSIHGRALLDSDDVILNDIRDIDALREIFHDRRPEVVFHAAALKHLPMLEQFPAEAVKTNVLGTRNVLQVSREVGVERFVNISTDKAANPASVLGYSKRVAEMITAEVAQRALAEGGGAYLSVRFGNVLGSRGSVLTAFASQIAAGGPVTVTDPEVTRYFMTIVEACQLVVQAAAIGEPGEALVLDMGEPIKILDVAKQLIDQSGRPIRIEFTGLREGEKMHEELFGDDEPTDQRPRHQAVSHVPVPGVDDAVIDSLPLTGPRRKIIDELASLC